MYKSRWAIIFLISLIYFSVYSINVYATDTTAPIVSGVTNGGLYNTDLTITFNEGTATLNGNTFTSGSTVSSEGNYTLNVIDDSFNSTIINFEIDKTAPTINIEDMKCYSSNVTLSFSGGIAYEGYPNRPGATIANGTVFSDEKDYMISVIDAAQNYTYRWFCIDKTAPIINLSLSNSSPTNQDITINVGIEYGSTHPWPNSSKWAVGIQNKSYFLNSGNSLGTESTSSFTVSSNNTYTVYAKDVAGWDTIQTISITNIDKTAPTISGISNNTYYNSNKSIVFTEGSATLNGVSYTSGTSISNDGNYTFIIKDSLNNAATYTFTIDKTAPIITIGTYDTDITNKDITVSASTNEGTLNASSHKFTSNGTYTFTATDTAGNITNQIVTITNIDKVAPTISGVANDGIYNVDKTITFSEGTATLNGNSFISGSKISLDGDYELICTDEAGNVSKATFTIDKTSPIITINNYSTSMTNQSIIVTATTNEGTLNASSHTFTSNGTFTFSVTDKAGNSTSKSITISNIDTVPPVISINQYTTAITGQPITVTATVNEGSLNSNSHTFYENGTFTFIATDSAGNQSQRTVQISNIERLVVDESNSISSAIDNSKGDEVTIVSNDSLILDVEVIQKLIDLGKNIVIEITNENGNVEYMWTLPVVNMNTAYEINTDISSDSVNQDKITQLLSHNSISKIVSFSHSGELPEGTKVKIYVGDKFSDGELINFYYFNEWSNDIEKIMDFLEVKDGYIEVLLSHASDYVILRSLDSSDENTSQLISIYDGISYINILNDKQDYVFPNTETKQTYFAKLNEDFNILYTWLIPYDDGFIYDNLDFEISESTDKINEASLNKLNTTTYKILDFNFKDNLPSNTEIEFYVGDKFENEDYLYLYEYSDSKGNFLEVCSKIQVINGHVVLEPAYGSLYVLTDTNLKSNIVIWIGIISVLIVGMIFVFNRLNYLKFN